jgi:outer membrane cobalamin receptor
MYSVRLFHFALCLGVCNAAFSQSVADSTLYLQEIVVIANPFEEVIPSQRLSGKEFRRLNTHSVADAIRYFSGIQIKDYGGVGGLKTVDLRSMGTHHLGVFYDGIQLGNAQNGQIDLGKFSLDNMEEISVYNGQKSEILQPAKDFGSAGTVYLRTRRPRFEGDRKTNLKMVLRTGSFGLINPSLLWEQKLSSSVSSSLNVESVNATGRYNYRYRRVNADGSVAQDTTAVRQNGDIASFRAEGGLNGYFEEGKWNLKSYFYDSERGIPGAIVNNVWKNSQRQWDRNFFTQASFQKRFSSAYELMFHAKYSNDYLRYLNPDTTLMLVDNSFRQKELYLSVAGKYTPLPDWDVSLSLDYQNNKLDSDEKDFLSPQRTTALLALASAYKWGNIKVLASLLGTFINDKASELSHAQTFRDKGKFTPAVFLTYRPWSKQDLIVRTFYKRIFRMATFNDLYYTEVISSDLQPEYTEQYNAGIQYLKNFNRTFRDFNFVTNLYYNKIRNKIIAVPKGSGQYRWMMMNIGKAEIRGMDVSSRISGYFTNDWVLNINLNYTFQKAQDFSDPKDTGDGGSWGGRIAYIPLHSGSVIAGGMYKDWDLNYSFIYVGGRYHNSANIRENYEQPWYTSDMSIGKQFVFKKVRFKLTGEVNNLLNQQYEVVLSYPMPGRNYKLTMRIEI